MAKIIFNRIKCNRCGEIIESKSRNNFVWCSCGSCAVDGGKDYLRRIGFKEDWTECSVVEKEDAHD